MIAHARLCHHNDMIRREALKLIIKQQKIHKFLATDNIKQIKLMGPALSVSCCNNFLLTDFCGDPVENGISDMAGPNLHPRQPCIDL